MKRHLQEFKFPLAPKDGYDQHEILQLYLEQWRTEWGLGPINILKYMWHHQESALKDLYEHHQQLLMLLMSTRSQPGNMGRLMV